MFKRGDRVKCINTDYNYIDSNYIDSNYVTVNKIYTVEDTYGSDYVFLVESEYYWYNSTFELVEDVDNTNTITFVIWEWDDWVNDIISRVTKQIEDSFNDPNGFTDRIDIEDLIHTPKLDSEDPRPFCKSMLFNNIYQNNIFVKHHTEKDCYWYIDSDNTSLIYKPKQA